MKKIIYMVILFLITACGDEYQAPKNILDNQITDNAQIFYSPSARIWSTGDMVEDRIMFEKHVSKGSGAYSEYIDANGPALTDFASNFEFLYNGRLIGYNVANFKFSEVIYQDSRFITAELSLAEVQKIFTDVKIVKLSSAKNGILKLRKWPFEIKSFLIYNDTEQEFYKYQFEQPLSINMPFNSIITVKEYGKYIYSHFGSREHLFPLLTLDVVL